MEKRPHDANRNSTSRRIHDGVTEKLEPNNKSIGEGTEKHEKAIRQEKKKSSRTKGWQPYVVGEQEHPIELTLKEVGQ